MKKLTKSAKIILTSVVSFVCVLAIVLGCVFGIKKPKKEEQPTPAMILADAICKNTNKPLVKTSTSEAFEGKCEVKDVEEINDNFFVINKSGKKQLYLYKKNSDGTFEYKDLTDKVSNGGFVENDAESFSIDAYNENYVILSSNYPYGEDKTFTNKVMKVISISNYENPVVIYEFDARNKNLYLEKSNIFLTENYFSFYYIKDFDVVNPNAAKVDVVLGKLSDKKLSENEILTISDKEISIFTDSMSFESKESFVSAKFGNEIVLLFVSEGSPKMYTEFSETDDVTYSFSEISNGSILVEKKTILREESQKTERSVLDEPNLVNYEYSVLNFDKNIKLKSLELDRNYSKATTVYLEDLNYIYICEQKSVDTVLQEDYISLYLDKDLNVILKYNSNFNENVIYAKDKYFVTSTKIVNQSGGIDKTFEPYVEGVADETPVIYSIGQSNVYTDEFVISTDNGYGLMRYDGSFVIDPEKSDLTYIYPVYGKFAIGKNANQEYFLIKTSDGSKSKIENFCDEKWVLDLLKFGFEGYVTNDDGIIKIYSFDGKVNFDLINSKFSQSTANGGIVKLSDAEGNNFFVLLNYGSSIFFNNTVTQTEQPTLSGSETEAEPYTDYYSSAKIYCNYYPGTEFGTITYSGSDPVNFTIKLAQGYVISEIKFKFTFWNSYEFGFKGCTYDVDGSTSISAYGDTLTYTSNWSMSVSDATVTYTASVDNDALFNRVKGLESDSFSITSIKYVEYNIDSDLAGGSGASIPASYRSIYYFTITQPSKTGYSIGSFTISGMDSATHYYNYNTTGYPATGTEESKTLYTASYVCFRMLRGTYGTVKFTYAWTAKTYTITYNANGGSGSNQTQDVTYDTSFTTLNSSTFTRTGYTLSSWNTSADGSGTKYATNTSNTWTTDSNITLYAIWTPKTYSAQLNSGDVAKFSDDIAREQKYIVSDAGLILGKSVFKRSIKTYEIPYKKLNAGDAYYIFVNKANNYFGPLLVSTVAENVHYSYTKWTYNKGGIFGDRYDNDGTVEVTNVNTFEYNGTTYYYNSFEGWLNYSSIVEAKKYDFSTIGTFYKKFDEGDSAETMVTWLLENYNRKYLYKSLSYDQIYEPIQPTKTGYYFDSWSYTYLEDALTHTFYKADGTETRSDDTTAEPGSGYVKFKNLKSSSGTAYLKANLLPIKYNLSYNYNGGSVASENPTSATYDVVFNLTRPTKYGYTFNKWSISGMDTTTHSYGSDSACSSSSTETSFATECSYFKNLTTVNDATITIEATWIANTYRVNYETARGNFTNSALDGKSFADSKNDVLYEVYFGSGDSRNLRVRKYDASDTYYGVAYASDIKKYGPLLISKNSTGVYYKYSTGKFLLIWTGEEEVTSFGGSFVYNGETYYYSTTTCWKTSENNLYYNGNDIRIFSDSVLNAAKELARRWNKEINDVSYSYNSTYSFSSFIPTNATGYTFNGFDVSRMEEGLTHKFYNSSGTETLSTTSASTSIGADSVKFLNLSSSSRYVKFLARWTANTYNIRYNLGDGSWGENAVHPSTATYDQTFQVSNNVIAPFGYTFYGWSISRLNGTWNFSKNGTSFNSSSTTSNTIDKSYQYFKNLNYTNGATVTFQAVFNANQYNVNLVANGTGVTLYNSTLKASFNSPFNVTNPIRIGYSFTGWALTGLSDEIVHNYKNFNSSNLVTLTQDFNSSNGAYVNPTNPNLYILVTSGSGNTYIQFLNLHYLTNATVTLTANWSPNSYNITYHYAMNPNFASFPDIDTVNTVSYMTLTKTQKVTFDQYFTTFGNAKYSGQPNALQSPTGYKILQWAICINTTLNGKTTESLVAYRCGVNTEYLFDYSFYRKNSNTSSAQITSIHAYPIYSSVMIEIKYYDALNVNGFNKIENYTNTSTVKVSYGGSLTIPTSEKFDTLAGYMISPNIYISGDVSPQVSVTKFVFDSSTYSAEAGKTIKWGISNEYAYNTDNPVFYLYAVYASKIRTDIENNGAANIYAYVSSGNAFTFTYGAKIYDTAQTQYSGVKYLIVRPGQTLTITEKGSDSSVIQTTTKPSDIATGKFFAAFGEYPQTFVGTSLNTTFKNSSLRTTGKTYSTNVIDVKRDMTEYIYNGKRYARLDSAKSYSTTTNKFVDGSTFSDDETYYFEVEPIVVRSVGDFENSECAVIPLDTLGSMVFDLSSVIWKESRVRQYLNEFFKKEAGLEECISSNMQTVNNNTKDSASSETSGDSTTEWIYLPSKFELDSWFTNGNISFASDLALASYTATKNYCANYMTRSVSTFSVSSSYYIAICIPDGTSAGSSGPDTESLGYRPVFRINFVSDPKRVVTKVENTTTKNLFVSANGEPFEFSYDKARYVATDYPNTTTSDNTVDTWIVVQPGQSVTIYQEGLVSTVTSTANAPKEDLKNCKFFAAFGNYPQSFVGDPMNELLKRATLTETGKTYTVGRNGTSVTMKEYTYQGKKYAKLENSYSYGQKTSFANEMKPGANGIETKTGKTYFFVVEPIVFAPYEVTDDEIRYIALSTFEQRAFATSTTSATWSTSAVRTFLNDTFVNESDLSSISKSATVKNNIAGDYTDGSGTSTTDKFWIPSLSEILAWRGQSSKLSSITTSLNGSSHSGGSVDGKCLRASDLSVALGTYAYEGNGRLPMHYLRTTSYSTSYVIRLTYDSSITSHSINTGSHNSYFVSFAGYRTMIIPKDTVTTTITNTSEEDNWFVYLTATENYIFSYGYREYDRGTYTSLQSTKYLMVRPGQTLTITEKTASSSVKILKSTPDAVASDWGELSSSTSFIAAYGEYPQTYVGDALNKVLNGTTLTATGKTYFIDGTTITSGGVKMTEYLYNGKKVVRVPFYPTSSSVGFTSFNDGTTIGTGLGLYFYVEPIVARAYYRDLSNGRYNMLTLDSVYQGAFGSSATSYETSDIYTVLNDNFVSESGLSDDGAIKYQGQYITILDRYKLTTYFSTNETRIAGASDVVRAFGSDVNYATASIIANSTNKLLNGYDTDTGKLVSNISMSSRGSIYRLVFYIQIETSLKISNNGSENYYISKYNDSDKELKFSFGRRKYNFSEDWLGGVKYIIVQPGQSVTLYSKNRLAQGLGIYSSTTTIPTDLELSKFFVAYGNYPQTYVGDALNEELKNATLTATGKTYTTDINGTSTTLVEYEYDGKKYAKLESSKAYSTTINGTVYKSLFNNGKEVETGETYFFEVEPIVSKMMEKNSSNNYVLMTLDVLGSSKFGTTNQWSASEIRTYLNGNFANESGLSNIAETSTVKNNSDANNMEDGSGTDTQDKIYLPSYTELISNWYNSSYNDKNAKRQAQKSDMASATYTEVNRLNDGNIYFGAYWTRTRDKGTLVDNLTLFTRCVNFSGSVYFICDKAVTTTGYRPVFAVSANELVHETVVTNSTAGNMWVEVTATNNYNFSYGTRVYTHNETFNKAKYLLLAPGESVRIYEKTASSSISTYSTKPADAETERFIAAFGSYPQTYVGDPLNEILKKATLTATGKTYTTDINGTTTTLNEYTYRGNKYVKLTATLSETKFETSDTAIVKGNDYYFVVEPIVTTYVGKNNAGTYNMMSLANLGSMAFGSSIWKDSEMRTFLNGNFLTESGLDSVACETKVWNSSFDSMFDGSGDSTIDKVWIMSLQEFVEFNGMTWSIDVAKDLLSLARTDSDSQTDFSDYNPYDSLIWIGGSSSDFKKATYYQYDTWLRTFADSGNYLFAIASSNPNYDLTSDYCYYSGIGYQPVFTVNFDAITVPDATSLPDAVYEDYSVTYETKEDFPNIKIATITSNTNKNLYISVNTNYELSFYWTYKENYKEYPFYYENSNGDTRYNWEMTSNFHEYTYVLQPFQKFRFAFETSDGSTTYSTIDNVIVMNEYIINNMYEEVVDGNQTTTYSNVFTSMGEYPQSFVGLKKNIILNQLLESDNFKSTGVTGRVFNTGIDKAVEYFDTWYENYNYNTFVGSGDLKFGTRRFIALSIGDFMDYLSSDSVSRHNFDCRDSYADYAMIANRFGVDFAQCTNMYEMIDKMNGNLGLNYVCFWVDPVVYQIYDSNVMDEDTSGDKILIQEQVIMPACFYGIVTVIADSFESSEFMDIMLGNGVAERSLFANVTKMSGLPYKFNQTRFHSSNTGNVETSLEDIDAELMIPSIWEIGRINVGATLIDNTSLQDAFNRGDYFHTRSFGTKTSDMGVFLGLEYGSYITRTINSNYGSGCIYVVRGENGQLDSENGDEPYQLCIEDSQYSLDSNERYLGIIMMIKIDDILS